MPYINPNEKRPRLDPAIALLAKALNTTDEDLFDRAGDFNYAVTRLLLLTFPRRKYGVMALARGILSDVQDEYYRRRVAPYEDEKIAENGDVY